MRLPKKAKPKVKPTRKQKLSRGEEWVRREVLQRTVLRTQLLVAVLQIVTAVHTVRGG